MLEFLDAGDTVLAVRIWGTITGKDLDAILDRLDGLLDRPGAVHVFVETQGLEGLELAALGPYMARAAPLFGQLRRFGRVAIVADQAWVRGGARLESAVLPFIDYRVFSPQAGQAALDWVSGGGA